MTGRQSYEDFHFVAIFFLCLLVAKATPPWRSLCFLLFLFLRFGKTSK